MITDPIEILRVIDDECFLSIPSTSDRERRERCNEIILSMNALLERAERERMENLSDAALARLITGPDEPRVAALREAAARLDRKSQVVGSGGPE